MYKEHGVEKVQKVSIHPAAAGGIGSLLNCYFPPRRAIMAGSYLCLHVCGHHFHQTSRPFLPFSVPLWCSTGDTGTAGPQGPGSLCPHPSSRTAAPLNLHHGQPLMALLPEACVKMRTISKVNVYVGLCTIMVLLTRN